MATAFISTRQCDLYVNLFIASELSWKQKGDLVIRQETQYPEEDTTRLVFPCSQPHELTVRVRHPAWAVDGGTVTLNGRTGRRLAARQLLRHQP